MLAVGRALMSDPKLLMLDEPSLGLAPAVVESMYETFGRLHREGLTILLAEQSIELALEVSDFATVLQVGKSVLSGTAAAARRRSAGAEGLSRHRLTRGAIVNERRGRLLDLVVGGGKVGKRHRNGDGLLAEVLKRHLQLLARFQRGQQIGRDRGAGIAAPRFAGLDLQVDRLAVIDLEFGAGRQIESERQLHERDRRVGIAGYANVDQHDQLSGLGQHRASARSRIRAVLRGLRWCSVRPSRAGAGDAVSAGRVSACGVACAAARRGLWPWAPAGRGYGREPRDG